MNKTNSTNVKQTLINLITTALFAAIITVTTAYILHFPVPGTNGYIHPGDCFIYLAACFLPTPYAMLAGAIGGGLADFVTPGAQIWILPTIIIKSLLVLPFTSKKNNIMNKRNIIGTVIGLLITTIGYYIAEIIIFNNTIAPIVSMVPSLIQAGGSGVLFVIIGFSLDKINIKSMIKKF